MFPCIIGGVVPGKNKHSRDSRKQTIYMVHNISLRILVEKSIQHKLSRTYPSMDISNVYKTIRNCLDNLYLLKEFNKTDSKHFSQICFSC